MFVFVVLPSRRAGAGLHSPAQHNHRASTHDYRRSRQRARLLAVATSKATNHLQEQPEAWENMADPGPGPAFKHSLRALEWSTVCQHIAAFASTLAGKQLCEDPVISTSYEEASRLQSDSKTVSLLEGEIGIVLDFGGIRTSEASTGLRRARKGALLDGSHALGVAGLIDGSLNLQRTMRNARHAVQGTQLHTQITPLVSRFLALNAEEQIADEVHSCIDEQGNVMDRASDTLKRARARCMTLEGRVRSVLQKLPGDITEHSERLCVAVPDGERGSKNQGIVLGSGVGVSYVEPGAAVSINNALVAAQAEALAAEEAVLGNITQLVSEHAYELEALLHGVADLDAARARSRYTEWVGGTYPELVPFPRQASSRGSKGNTQKNIRGNSTSTGEQQNNTNTRGEEFQDWEQEAQGRWVHLMRLRHPLLFGWYLKDLAAWNKANPKKATNSTQSVRTGLLAGSSGLAGASDAPPEPRGGQSGARSGAGGTGGKGSEPPTGVVPVNMSIEDSTRCVVITGPNTGGKTASLKALGLSALLTQSGCGVPARAPARMPVFSAILADIGDSQGLAASLSTFSGHLRRISAARMESDSRSLILLDELGTGTDPAEGASLAAALLTRLVKGGPGGAALTVATTHMSSLARLKLDIPHRVFENASAEFDDELLSPTYRLLWGVPGRSCALSVAAGLGVPQAIIDEAKEVVGTSQVRMDGLVGDLERLRGASEGAISSLETTEAHRKRLEAQVQEAEKKVAGLKAEIDVRRAATVAPAAETILKGLQRYQRQEEKERAAAKNEKSEARKKKSQAKSKQKRVTQQFATQKDEDWKPKVGDTVEVPKLGSIGQVQSLKGKKVVVAVGAMPVTVKITDVLRV